MKGNILLGILITVFLIMVVLPSSAMADVSLTKNAGAGSNLDTGGNEWSINAPGSPFASIDAFGSSVITSDLLIATNFGFTSMDIPDSVTIKGITVSIRRRAENEPLGSFSDYQVCLLNNMGVNKAAMGIDWPSSWVTATYGGPSDLWGFPWEPADIRSDSFGVALSVTEDALIDMHLIAEVDWIQVTVTYSTIVSTTHNITYRKNIGSGDTAPTDFPDANVTVDFSECTSSSGYLNVQDIDATPLRDVSPSRYWSLNSSGLADYTYDITLEYTDSEITKWAATKMN